VQAVELLDGHHSALQLPSRTDRICGPLSLMALGASDAFSPVPRIIRTQRAINVTRQSGKKTGSGKAGKRNPWLNGILGEIAACASRTDTFLGERYRRLARRRGKRKALTPISRSILVIIFCLLSDRSARYNDLGPDFYDTQLNRDRRICNHIRQLRALGISNDEITTLLRKGPAGVCQVNGVTSVSVVTSVPRSGGRRR
jgi:hypothetical protein